MTTEQYNKIQLKWIHKLAKHHNITDEEACYIWIRMSATKFAEIYIELIDDINNHQQQY
jgi:hypothetical protein